MPELTALARPSAPPPAGLQRWDLGPVAAWVGPALREPGALAERVIALGHAHLTSPVLPFRAGHDAPDPRALAAMLGDLGPWGERLEALAGWVELGVHWPRPPLAPVQFGPGPGGSWLARRRTAHAPALAADAALAEVRQLLATLPHEARTAGTEVRTVRVALLVRADAEGGARALLAPRATAVTGPWAPASFAGPRHRSETGSPPTG